MNVYECLFSLLAFSSEGVVFVERLKCMEEIELPACQSERLQCIASSVVRYETQKRTTVRKSKATRKLQC